MMRIRLTSRLAPRASPPTRASRALADGDGVRPAADGYALIAETVGAWLSWRAWFDT